jgi:hypothetical protein
MLLCVADFSHGCQIQSGDILSPFPPTAVSRGHHEKSDNLFLRTYHCIQENKAVFSGRNGLSIFRYVYLRARRICQLCNFFGTPVSIIIVGRTISHKEYRIIKWTLRNSTFLVRHSIFNYSSFLNFNILKTFAAILSPCFLPATVE